MKFKLEESGHIAILSLCGEIRSEHHATLRYLLMKMLHGFDYIVVNVKEVIHIDTCARKLLDDMRKSTVKLKKNFSLIGMIAEETG